MKQNAMNEIKQDLYDVSYLKKRYRKIVAKNEKALFMADHECLKCVYFQRLARKCQANCKCPLERIYRRRRIYMKLCWIVVLVGISIILVFLYSLVAMSSRSERFIEQLMEEEGRKGTDEQDMEAIITEGKERQEHE